MRVFILASHAASLKNFRGALIEAIISRGHEVQVGAPRLSEDVDTTSWLRSRGIVCHDVPMSRTRVSPINDLLVVLRLTVLMSRVRPDVFLAYTIKPVIWGMFAARLVGVSRNVALITGLGYVFTGHDQNWKRSLIRHIVSLLYRKALRLANLIIFQNSDDCRDMARIGIVPMRVPTVIVNGSGVDLKHYSKASFPDTHIKVLMIARLLGNKGVREFMKAAAKIVERAPQVRFELVGGLDDNPDALSVEEVEAWIGKGCVTWAGELKDVRPSLASAHIYVLPSYREGMPRSVLEAMAMGRPVITTDVPGCRETVIPGENGFLVPPRNVEALVDAIERFIREPELIERMGMRSRQLAEEKFDVHKVNTAMLEAMEL